MRFFKENKQLLKEYIDVRGELLKLQAIKILSRSLSLLLVIVIVSFSCAFCYSFPGYELCMVDSGTYPKQYGGFCCRGGAVCCFTPAGYCPAQAVVSKPADKNIYYRIGKRNARN
ncbi:MAG: hypothetical protein HC867_05760 [Bacteroidia bacterium]|nr:hypothetical protein [Bacteroidia bacterium]